MLPFIFSGRPVDDLYLNIFYYVVSILNFSLITSSIYIFNDIKDRNQDAKNSIKKHRPLASGKIKPTKALFVVLIIYVIVYVLYEYFSLQFGVFYLIYILNNTFYNFVFKNLNIINSVVISIGFVIRIFFGSFLFETSLDTTIILMVFLTALIMSITKKYSDKIEENVTSNKLKVDLKFINFLLYFIFLVYCFHLNFELMLRFEIQLISIALFLFVILRFRYIIRKIDRSVDFLDLTFKEPLLSVLCVLWFYNYYIIRYLT